MYMQFPEFFSKNCMNAINNETVVGDKNFKTWLSTKKYEIEKPDKVTIQNLKTICSSDSTVDNAYITRAVKNYKGDTTNKFEIIVLKGEVDERPKRERNPTAKTKEKPKTTHSKAKKEIGFLLIQHGECDKYPNTPVIQLVCSNKSGVGNILIYYYLRSMIYHYEKHESPDENYRYGLLELGSTYRNIKGLCLYEKYGFREDYSLLSEGCFGVPGTIPMKVDISRFTDPEEMSKLRKILTETKGDKSKNDYVKPRIGDDYDRICDLRGNEQTNEIEKRTKIYNEMIPETYGEDYLNDTKERKAIIDKFNKAKTALRGKRGKAKTVKKKKGMAKKKRGKTAKRKKTRRKSSK